MGGIGGAIGAGWAAKRLPSTSAARTVHLQVPAGDAVRSAFNAITKVGRILGGNVEQATPTFRGVVGSGFLDMNPAVVEVTIEPASANQTAIHIQATAKEGLIKQGHLRESHQESSCCGGVGKLGPRQAIDSRGLSTAFAQATGQPPYR